LGFDITHFKHDAGVVVQGLDQAEIDQRQMLRRFTDCTRKALLNVKSGLMVERFSLGRV